MSFAEKMSFSVLIFPLYIMMKGISPYRDNAWVLRLKCQPGSGNGKTVKLLKLHPRVMLLESQKQLLCWPLGCVSKRCFEWCKIWGKRYTTCFRSSRIKLYFDSCKNLIGMNLQALMWAGYWSLCLHVIKPSWKLIVVSWR